MPLLCDAGIDMLYGTGSTGSAAFIYRSQYCRLKCSHVYCAAAVRYHGIGSENHCSLKYAWYLMFLLIIGTLYEVYRIMYVLKQ